MSLWQKTAKNKCLIFFEISVFQIFPSLKNHTLSKFIHCHAYSQLCHSMTVVCATQIFILLPLLQKEHTQELSHLGPFGQRQQKKMPNVFWNFSFSNFSLIEKPYEKFFYPLPCLLSTLPLYDGSLCHLNLHFNALTTTIRWVNLSTVMPTLSFATLWR